MGNAEEKRSEDKTGRHVIGVREYRTAYVIPARAGVWRVWWASWGRPGDSGLSLLLLLSLASGPRSSGGRPSSARGGVFRGTFRAKGDTGKCSPKRDLRFGVLRTPPAKGFFRKERTELP